jgi:hypothetical protein
MPALSKSMSNPITLTLSEPHAAALRLILELQSRELVDALARANLACDGKATRLLATVLEGCEQLREMVEGAVANATVERVVLPLLEAIAHAAGGETN